MKVYIGSNDLKRVTFDIDKEFESSVTEESFQMFISEFWCLRKVLLSTSSIKDICLAAGTLKTVYGTEINCFQMSTYAKLLVLSFIKYKQGKELIIPFGIVQSTFFLDGLIDWFLMCETSLYFDNKLLATIYLNLFKSMNIPIKEMVL